MSRKECQECQLKKRKAVATSMAAEESKAVAERMSGEIKESCRVKHDSMRQANSTAASMITGDKQSFRVKHDIWREI